MEKLIGPADFIALPDAQKIELINTFLADQKDAFASHVAAFVARDKSKKRRHKKEDAEEEERQHVEWFKKRYVECYGNVMDSDSKEARKQIREKIQRLRELNAQGAAHLLAL